MADCIKIVVGFDQREAIAYHTFSQSVLEKSSLPVLFLPLSINTLKGYKETHNDKSNDFVYSRFLTPYLHNFEGWAIFADGDMVCQSDIKELWDLREPLGRIVVELKSNRDLTRSGNTLGLDVIDPSDRRNRLLDRCGQKPANRLGAGADVNRRDDDRGAFKLRELLYRQRLHRSHPQKHNHQVHDDRKYRVANKDIGDGFHRGA